MIEKIKQLFKSDLNKVIAVVLVILFVLTGYASIVNAEVFGGNYFRRSGTALITVPSTLTLGSPSNPVSAGYFDILNASTTKFDTMILTGASAGDLPMAGFQILDAGKITGTHFSATSTTATSNFLGSMTVGTTTDSARLSIGQPNDTDGLRIYGWDDKAGNYADMFVNEYGNFIIDGAHGLVNFRNSLRVDDDKTITLGSGSDYKLSYESGSTQLQLNATDIDGIGTDGNVFEIQDGTDDINFFGNVGVGTVTPSSPLDVNGMIDSHTALVSDKPGFVVYADDGKATGLTVGTGASAFIFENTGRFGIQAVTRSNVLAGNTDANNEKFTVLAGGNVGIGITSPVHKLDIAHAGATTYSDFAANLDGERIYNSNTTAETGSAFIFESGSTNNAISIISGVRDSADNSSLRFQTENAGTIAEAMRISPAGYLGIGTTSPYAKLSVVGETVSEYFTATSTTATSTFAGGLRVNIAEIQSGFISGLGTSGLFNGTFYGNSSSHKSRNVIYATTTDESISSALWVQHILDPTATITGTRRASMMNIESALGNANDMGTLRAVQSAVDHVGTGTITNGVVQQNFVDIKNSGVITNGYGVLNTLGTTASGATGSYTNLYGVYNIPQIFGVDVTNFYGFYVDNILDIGGTITNGYGVYIREPTFANYFAGNVGIGETAPGSKLSVSGGGSFGSGYDTITAPTNGLIIEGNLGIGTTTPYRALSITDTMNIEPRATAPTAPILGDIYVDSDTNEFCFYNGSAWTGLVGAGACS